MSKVKKVYLSTKGRKRPLLRFVLNNGREVSRSLHLDCNNKKDIQAAEQVLTEIRRKIALSTFSITEYLPQTETRISLKDFAALYLKHRKKEADIKRISRRTYDTDFYTFKIFNEVIGSHKMVSEVDSRMIDYFIEMMKNKKKKDGKPYAEGSTRTYLYHLASAFTFAVDSNYIQSNPFSRYQHPVLKRKETLEPYCIEPDQVKQILDAANQARAKWHSDIIRFALATGMREAEIFNVNINNISSDKIDGQEHHFLNVKGKGSKYRWVPLSRTANDIIKRRAEYIVNHYMVAELSSLGANRYKGFQANLKRANEGFIFFEITHPDRITKMFMRLIDRVFGTEAKIRFHDLRHTFAYNYIANGGRIEILKEILGHADLKTTQIYSRLTKRVIKENIDDFTDILRTN